MLFTGLRFAALLGVMMLVGSTALAREITIHVQDEEGNAVTDARVFLQVALTTKIPSDSEEEDEELPEGIEPPEAAGSPIPTEFTVRTADVREAENKGDGSYTVIPMSLGNYAMIPYVSKDMETHFFLVASAPGYSFTEVPYKVEELLNAREQTLTLKPGHPIKIRVLNEDGSLYSGETKLLVDPFAYYDEYIEFPVQYFPDAETQRGEFDIRLPSEDFVEKLTLHIDKYSRLIPVWTLPSESLDGVRIISMTAVEPGTAVVSLPAISGELPQGVLSFRSNVLTLSIVEPEADARTHPSFYSNMIRMEDIRANQPTYFIEERLCPGEYEAEMQIGDSFSRWDPENYSGHYESRRFTVKSGEVSSVRFKFELPSAEQFEGTDSIVLMNSMEGVDPENLVVFGARANSLELKLAVTPTLSNDKIVLNDVKIDPMNRYIIKNDKAVFMRVFVESETDYHVKLLPAVGLPAPRFTEPLLDGDEEISLSSLEGKVVYIDFWATWCGPCQQPIQKLNDVAKKRRTDWGDDVVVLAISIDDRREVARNHVSEKAWDSIVHLFATEGGSGWKAEIVDRYAINSIPAAFLIDQQGKISWMGSPYSADAEELIDSLLAAGK